MARGAPRAYNEPGEEAARTTAARPFASWGSERAPRLRLPGGDVCGDEQRDARERGRGVVRSGGAKLAHGVAAVDDRRAEVRLGRRVAGCGHEPARAPDL